jgi:hypothetical protein
MKKSNRKETIGKGDEGRGHWKRAGGKKEYEQ